MIGKARGFFKYLHEHLASEFSGLGVLVGGVVGSQQDIAVRQFVFCAVGKDILRFAFEHTPTLQIVQIGIKANFSQRDYDLQFLQAFNFAIQIRRAVGQLLRQGLVVGRCAAGGGGDEQVVELEPVVPVGGRGLIGEAGFVEHRVHEVAGSVAGEGTASTVGTVGSGGEAENEDTGIGIAKGGDGLAPVVVVAVGAALLAGDLLAVGDEARALGAGDDFAVEDGEPGRGVVSRLGPLVGS